MLYKSMNSAVQEAIQYIDNRRKGKELPLYTRKKKLNAALDGFTWGRIYTLAGLSGAGKSITIEEIKRDLVDCNKDEKFEVLSFEFEMLAIDQITRNLSGKIGKTVAEIYSANSNFLQDKDFNLIKEVAEEFKVYPISYVDTVGTILDIKETIFQFIEDKKIKEKDKGLIVTIDHILLTKGLGGQNEKEIIDGLMHLCVELKKYFSSEGTKVMFILLSQLNRDIEKQERVMNPMFHMPTKNDIFAASSVYYCSDVVLILHKPAIIEGIGPFYGPSRTGYPKGLPIFTEDNHAMIYWHVIKSRFGENQILMMVDDFVHSRVLEYDPSLFKSS